MSSLDILKDLQDRVTALERQLGDTPGTDNLQPNVLTVNPDGTIGASFTGSVYAKGFDMDPLSSNPATGQPSSPPHAVQWRVGGPSGALVADIYAGADAGSPGHLQRRSYSVWDVIDLDTLPGQSVAGLSLNNTPWLATKRSALLNILNDDNATRASYTLIDSSNNSSFLQLLTNANLKLQFGAGVTLDSGATGSPAGNSIALPTPWPNNHFLFMASVTGDGAQWPTYYGGGVVDLAHGQIILSTAAAAFGSNFDYQWISLGN